LPIGVFRPLAITGELSYNIPDRRKKLAASNNGSPSTWARSLSLQDSFP
jgi:hypothetical protein